MGRLRRDTSRPKRLGAPARTLEARENQLIAAAVDLAEKQLSEGTASSQVITHFLKLGTTREILEKEKLIEENKHLRAKTEALKSEKIIEELYIDAIKAMSRYSGQQTESDGDDDEPKD